MQDAGTNRLHVASLLMIAVGLLNFLTFVAISLYLGGDAVNGKTQEGHYSFMVMGCAAESRATQRLPSWSSTTASGMYTASLLHGL